MANFSDNFRRLFAQATLSKAIAISGSMYIRDISFQYLICLKCSEYLFGFSLEKSLEVSSAATFISLFAFAFSNCSIPLLNALSVANQIAFRIDVSSFSNGIVAVTFLPPKSACPLICRELSNFGVPTLRSTSTCRVCELEFRRIFPNFADILCSISSMIKYEIK